MTDNDRIGLDNPAFIGRLRQHDARNTDSKNPQNFKNLDGNLLSDIVEKPSHRAYFRQARITDPFADIDTQIQADDLIDLEEPSAAQIPETITPIEPRVVKKKAKRSRAQYSLVAMSIVVFAVGVSVSIQTLLTNHAATAQVSALSNKDNNAPATNDGSDSDSPPSTNKLSASAVNSYAVAPDLARYLKIPSIGVSARVLQVGVKSNGALGTPNNVFDTAWYTGSAKPGQPGATLIDGHVSSWTTHGVFYGIKRLKNGDALQIVRGDGSVVNYEVKKTQVYSADNVDMQAAITPITAGKSGLNLISCNGKVKPGTSEFTERIIVFAEQI